MLPPREEQLALIPGTIPADIPSLWRLLTAQGVTEAMGQGANGSHAPSSSLAATATSQGLPATAVAFGLCFVLAGTTSVAVGLHLWKWSHETEAELPLLRRKKWWLGLFFGCILLLICDTISYALLPLSLIAPFGGLPILISASLSAGGQPNDGPRAHP